MSKTINSGRKTSQTAEYLAGPYREIPKRLREFYESLEQELLPNRFLDLLEKLEQAELAAGLPMAAEEQKS
jgi:hypothetical protein